LGRAIAASLAREGAKIAVADIDPNAVARTQDVLAALGARSIGLEWDLGDLAKVEAHFTTIEAELGPVDVLVNNTGGPPPTPASGQDPALWSKHFQSMVVSVIAITDRALPRMRVSKWGRIITSTSSGVVAPIPNLGVSNALRLSLVGWSKTLAREVGRDGITANIVLPGRISTDRITFLDEAKAKREVRPLADVVAESTGSIPLGRYGKPEEYADVVAFLASERAAYLTGSVIRVDGGLIASI
jgi:3-oxoacyl-[acyl-carrier protein] reductase